MKTTHFRLAAVVVLGAALAACAQPTAEDEGAVEEAAVDAAAVEQGIEDLRTRYEQAYEAGDVAALAGMYTEDAVLVSPAPESPLEGRDAIRASLEQEFAGMEGLGEGSLTIEKDELVIAASGDVAYESGTSTFEATTSAGETVTERSRYLVGFENVDGQWQVHRLVILPIETGRETGAADPTGDAEATGEEGDAGAEPAGGGA